MMKFDLDQVELKKKNFLLRRFITKKTRVVKTPSFLCKEGLKEPGYTP